MERNPAWTFSELLKAALAGFVSKWKAKYQKLGIWAEKAENVLTFYGFPEALEKRMVSLLLHYNDDPGRRKVR